MKARFEPFNDLLLERYLAGELEAQDVRRIEEAAATRPELADYLRSRRADREAFKLKRPPLKLPAEAPPRLAWRWAFGAALALAAALLVVVLVPQEPDNGIAMRGDAGVSVEVAVLRGADVFAYRDGVVLLPKDRIRLTLKAPKPGLATLVARDARGEPQLLYEGVRVSGETTLPDSLELDDTPGAEELYVFFASERAVSAADAIERARRGEVRDATVVKLVKGRP